MAMTVWVLTGMGFTETVHAQNAQLMAPVSQVNVQFIAQSSNAQLYRPANGDGIVPSSLADSYNDNAGTLKEDGSSNIIDFSYDSLTVAYDVILSAGQEDSVNSVELVFMYDKKPPRTQ